MIMKMILYDSIDNVCIDYGNRNNNNNNNNIQTTNQDFILLPPIINEIDS